MLVTHGQILKSFVDKRYKRYVLLKSAACQLGGDLIGYLLDLGTRGANLCNGREPFPLFSFLELYRHSSIAPQRTQASNGNPDLQRRVHRLFMEFQCALTDQQTAQSDCIRVLLAL